MAVSVSSAAVDATSTLFTHPRDLTEPIFGALPLAIAAAAAVICVIGLVRGRLSESLFATGVVTLPLVAYALANAVLLDRSKETQFCTSCHTMEPVYQSTLADDGSLASFHVSNGATMRSQSCYTCHSGYGMQGDVGAKWAGVNHMIHTVLGNYDYPLEMRSPYDIDGCLSCHAESRSFRNEVHASPEISSALLAGDLSCTGTCHPAAHPAEALADPEAAP